MQLLIVLAIATIAIAIAPRRHEFGKHDVAPKPIRPGRVHWRLVVALRRLIVIAQWLSKPGAGYSRVSSRDCFINTHFS